MKGNLCNSIKIAGETVNGGYAELISIKEEFVTHMPYSIEFEHVVPLFCLGVTAYKAVRAAEPTLDKSIGVFGSGGVGHLAIQFAKL